MMLQYLESPLFSKKRSAKHIFVGIYEMFNITSSTNLDSQMWSKKRIISFDDSNFVMDNYCFFSSYEIAVGKKVKQQLR